ncbi:energy transducer TonB [Roseateles asaccharophilus]|uniref:Protein TonB n=1 Tax=Roseateles asaccharophilus TaxID=582607 RepID=A0ABU2A821_9BURK|nr:energy transducer TonB [Roseateles asaccharophilus]MDR7333344.1 protein TonB [Roseateles asaccharophilus]
MTSATPVIVESDSPAPQRVVMASGLPPARGDELGPNGRRALIGGVVALHLVGGWGLLQVQAVRDAVREVAPVLMVNMIAPPEPPKAAPPPPPPAQPKRMAPAPAPIIAAAPSPTPAPAAFVTPPPDPVPPAPVEVAAAPPAPVPAPPAPVSLPKQVPPSAVRYVKLPDLNFPALAKRAREQGTVVLRITVDVNGRLKHATVHRSSGFERIDQAALRDIQSARFAPQTEDGKAVEWQTLAPLAYEL